MCFIHPGTNVSNIDRIHMGDVIRDWSTHDGSSRCSLIVSVSSPVTVSYHYPPSSIYIYLFCISILQPYHEIILVCICIRRIGDVCDIVVDYVHDCVCCHSWYLLYTYLRVYETERTPYSVNTSHIYTQEGTPPTGEHMLG